MAEDALDPGPDGTYPHWPRTADGTPDPERMPTGQTRHRIREGERRGEVVSIDQTPRDPNGAPIEPPDLPPEEAE